MNVAHMTFVGIPYDRPDAQVSELDVGPAALRWFPGEGKKSNGANGKEPENHPT